MHNIIAKMGLAYICTTAAAYLCGIWIPVCFIVIFLWGCDNGCGMWECGGVGCEGVGVWDVRKGGYSMLKLGEQRYMYGDSQACVYKLHIITTIET